MAVKIDPPSYEITMAIEILGLVAASEASFWLSVLFAKICSSGVFRTQSKLYDGAFLRK